MAKIGIILFLLLASFNTKAINNPDELPETKLVFSVFKDTIVCGFDTEFQIQTSYNLKNLSISGSGCSIMLKDAEKGIYVVKVPVASVGKTSVITISLVSNGSVRVIHKANIPIVSMSTSMKKRYVNHQIHKK